MAFQSTMPCEEAAPRLRRSYSEGDISSLDCFKFPSVECSEECDVHIVEKNTFFELVEIEAEEQQCLWDYPKRSCKGDQTPCSTMTLSTNGDVGDSSDDESWSASMSRHSTFEVPSWSDVSPMSQRSSSTPAHPPGVFPPGVFAAPVSFCMPENDPSWVDSSRWPCDEIVEITAGRSSRRRHRRRTCRLTAAEEQRGPCVTNGWPTKPTNQQEENTDERTTLLLKNIPASCTTAMLVDMLNSQGFEGCYNFVYAPTDFRSMTSFGYGFANLVSHSEAIRMMETLDGFDEWSGAGVNPMEVVWSMAHQGLDLQIKRFQNSPVMHPSVPDEIKPMIFTDGVRSPFPEPTKQLREPRARRPVSEIA